MGAVDPAEAKEADPNWWEGGTHACCLPLCIWSPPPWSPFAGSRYEAIQGWRGMMGAVDPAEAGGGRGKGTGGGRGRCIVIAHVAWIEPSTVLCRTCWGVGWGKLTLLNVICTLCK